jgi:hypothetical protein
MVNDDKPEITRETIIDVSAQISHEIVDGAKDRANELIHLPFMVFRFLKNPISFMATTPDLKTVTWVVLTLVSGSLGAAVNALVHQNIWRFFIALLIIPPIAFLSVFAETSILKLVFRGAHGLRFRYRSGASIFAFANIFWWVPFGAAEKYPPLALLGFFAALVIAGIGFTTKLRLPRGLVARWLALLAVAHVALWSLGRWMSA